MEEADRLLNMMELRDDVPTVEELLASSLSRFITLAANSCADMVVYYPRIDCQLGQSTVLKGQS